MMDLSFVLFILTGSLHSTCIVTLTQQNVRILERMPHGRLGPQNHAKFPKSIMVQLEQRRSRIRNY